MCVRVGGWVYGTFRGPVGYIIDRVYIVFRGSEFTVVWPFRFNSSLEDRLSKPEMFIFRPLRQVRVIEKLELTLKQGVIQVVLETRRRLFT